ncbi:TetR family transcriptional regulator [Leptospira wolffii]|uniref:TetR family transcriptional regulator n=1 Tax=Leptospira wolffii TaxID=409998 RepID=A0ABV5BRZ3_9LEPT|nr:TetR family transcriptional regulator [Leptospira wolffii]EPG67287.1 transcriptional regulator, TetR family [Leptospira wolffii serovar Khorat str. Khorat-H2]
MTGYSPFEYSFQEVDKKRARNPEEKEVRKRSIVTALRTLLEKSKHPLPTAQDVAEEAGVTKGVIYFYFKTREEIFLSLHLRETEIFFQEIAEALQEKNYSLDTLKKKILKQFTQNDVFMFLGSIIPGILESNVDTDFLYEFKLKSSEGMDALARAWVQREPRLTIAVTRQFILRFYFLGLMLWQHHNPPKEIKEAFASKNLWMLEGDLEHSLSESFDWLWKGMLPG